jgi:putative ABC transport system permease protein
MRLFRLLLHLYPASFRAEYGAEMSAIFAERRREAGGPAVAGLWLETIADVVVNATKAQADVLRQDLAFSARTLRRAPGFALTAVMVAALGIGATTAAFSVTDHILFRPLPLRDPDRLVRLWQDQSGYARTELSPANFQDWKRRARSFESMGAFWTNAYNLSGDGPPERISGAAMTADVYAVLGVPAERGRFSMPEDEASGARDTVVLSHGLWQARFGGEESAIGRTVLLDGAPYVVIGVMPPSFHFPSREAEAWTSLPFDRMADPDRTNTYLGVVARLAEGVSVAQARAEMRLITARLERDFPDANARTGATVHLLRDELGDQARLLPLALLGAAGCVQLIACTNLTSLLISRAVARRKELAVRAALGAGRDRLVRQLLTESLILALAGGLLGVLIASAAVPVLAHLVPNQLPIAEVPPMDIRVLAFALALTTATGLAFGLLPALRACSTHGVSGLHEGPGAGLGGRRERVRSLLVVAEVTASVVLLVSCGLLLRALWRVETVDPGFRPENVLTLETALPQPRYAPTARREQFYGRVLSEVRALPAVTAAAYISNLPMVMRGGIWPVVVPGESHAPGDRPMAMLRFATPGFFSALGIPLKAGRDLRDSDTREAPFVAVVSESLARRHWPGQDALGRRFQIGQAERTIVGIVGDVRARGLERASEPQVYLPSAQVADGAIVGYSPQALAVRASGDPLSLVPAIREIVHRADAEQPVARVRLLSAIVDGETAPRRIQVHVLAGFATAAFLLAAVGLHGLLSFAVSTRAQEIGVRLALGARSADILGMVLRDAVAMAGVGVVLGLVLAYGAGRGLEALLAGVRPGDAATFLAATGLAVVMTLAGSLVPALRALSVDPLAAMRAE